MRWETLNAYVDGELDAQSRHEVAETLALDPVLAARVATLTRLKQGVKAAVVRPRRVPAWDCSTTRRTLVVVTVETLHHHRSQLARSAEDDRCLRRADVQLEQQLLRRWILFEVEEPVRHPVAGGESSQALRIGRESGPDDA